MSSPQYKSPVVFTNRPDYTFGEGEADFRPVYTTAPEPLVFNQDAPDAEDDTEVPAEAQIEADDGLKVVTEWTGEVPPTPSTDEELAALPVVEVSKTVNVGKL